MRAAHLVRLRAQGPVVLAVVELYLEAYQEAVEVGVTAPGLPVEEFNQRAGELRMIRTLRADLKEDMAVVFPELFLKRKEAGRG